MLSPIKILHFISICFLTAFVKLHSQTLITNVGARNIISLNGNWQIIVDPFNSGDGRQIWKDQNPVGKTDFYEYKFDEAITLHVPGDWNSQKQELLYYEGTVWYKKSLTYKKKKNKRAFLYFAGANYQSDIYLNSEKLGSHEGGFTPFQFEITDKLKDSNNFLVVRVNNERREDAIPAIDFDWWNYGGITRDVCLIETSIVFIEDYSLQLKKGTINRIEGWLKLNGASGSTPFQVKIPQLKIDFSSETNDKGRGEINLNATPVLWSPENPRLYSILFRTDSDTIYESIGFRKIEVKGSEILLNGKSIFLKGVNIHEEIPQRMGRAYSETDAKMLLGWARELGCNFVRLAHYPQNEHMVELADQMGIMLWEEVPLWQEIQFSNPAILKKANNTE